MSMVNFDENQIIANGAKIYDQRAKIEAIADSIVDNGFDLLLFLCLGSPAAARAAMGAGGVCGLFSAYAAAALKPFSRLR